MANTKKLIDIVNGESLPSLSITLTEYEKGGWGATAGSKFKPPLSVKKRFMTDATNWDADKAFNEIATVYLSYLKTIFPILNDVPLGAKISNTTDFVYGSEKIKMIREAIFRAIQFACENKNVWERTTGYSVSSPSFSMSNETTGWIFSSSAWGHAAWALLQSTGLDKFEICDGQLHYNGIDTKELIAEGFTTDKDTVDAIKAWMLLQPVFKGENGKDGKDGSGAEWLTDHYADVAEFGSTAPNNTIVSYDTNIDGTPNSQGILFLAKVNGGLKSFITWQEAKTYVDNHLALKADRADIAALNADIAQLASEIQVIENTWTGNQALTGGLPTAMTFDLKTINGDKGAFTFGANDKLNVKLGINGTAFSVEHTMRVNTETSYHIVGRSLDGGDSTDVSFTAIVGTNGVLTVKNWNSTGTTNHNITDLRIKVVEQNPPTVAVIDAYTKAETDNKLATKADVGVSYTKLETETKLAQKANVDLTNVSAGVPNANKILKTDATGRGTWIDLVDSYSKTESDGKYATKTELGTKANSNDVYTKNEIADRLLYKVSNSHFNTEMAKKADLTYVDSHFMLKKDVIETVTPTMQMDDTDSYLLLAADTVVGDHTLATMVDGEKVDINFKNADTLGNVPGDSVQVFIGGTLPIRILNTAGSAALKWGTKTNASDPNVRDNFQTKNFRVEKQGSQFNFVKLIDNTGTVDKAYVDNGLAGKQDKLTPQQLINVNNNHSTFLTANDISGKLDTSVFQTAYNNINAALQDKTSAQDVDQKIANKADVGASYTKAEADGKFALTSSLSGKQATLTSPQLAAVNSGITAAKVAQIESNRQSIEHLTSGGAFLGDFPIDNADPTKAQIEAKYPNTKAGDRVEVIKKLTDGLEFFLMTKQANGTWSKGDVRDYHIAGSSYNDAALRTLINGKQDALSQAQLDAVNSGITAAKVAKITTNALDINVNSVAITANNGKITQIKTDMTDKADRDLSNVGDSFIFDKLPKSIKEPNLGEWVKVQFDSGTVLSHTSDILKLMAVHDIDMYVQEITTAASGGVEVNITKDYEDVTFEHHIEIDPDFISTDVTITPLVTNAGDPFTITKEAIKGITSNIDSTLASQNLGGYKIAYDIKGARRINSISRKEVIVLTVEITDAAKAQYVTWLKKNLALSYSGNETMHITKGVRQNVTAYNLDTNGNIQVWASGVDSNGAPINITADTLTSNKALNIEFFRKPNDPKVRLASGKEVR